MAGENCGNLIVMCWLSVAQVLEEQTVAPVCRKPLAEREEYTWATFDGACRWAYNLKEVRSTASGEGPLQRGPYEPGQGGNTAAISLCLFVWRPLTGGRKDIAKCKLIIAN